MTEHRADELFLMLRGEANREWVASIAAHLRGCAECRAEVGATVVAHAALRSTTEPKPPV